MTTIDEVIECCEEIAEDLEEREKIAREADWKYANFCKERAENNRQLAEWLKDYKRLLSVFDDIKAEISSKLITHGQVIDGEYFAEDAEYINYGLNMALEIIDKHIGKE